MRTWNVCFLNALRKKPPGISLENRPKKVILHCSATPDYSVHQERFDKFGAADIDLWHRERGFKGIGYHWVIRRNGMVEPGRTEQTIGAHCQGYNYGSIGICYIGTKQITDFQLESLAELYKEINQRWKIDAGNWFGHYQFNPNKTCPGFKIEIIREYLNGTIE